MTTKPPSHGVGLDGPAAEFYDAVLADFALNVGERQLLLDAAREIAILERLTDEAKDADTVVKGSYGQPVLSPLIEGQRSHRLALATLLKALGLPAEDEGGPAVPHSDDERRRPMTRSESARVAARARWHSESGT